MPALDPNPANELGTGQLAPAVEQWLLNRGAVFARRTPGGAVEFSARPLHSAMSDAARDAVRVLGGSTFSVPPIGSPVPAAVVYG